MTQRLVEGVPTRRLTDDPERWSSGLFYDWTHGLADAIHHAGKHPSSVLFVVVLLEKVDALRSSHGCFTLLVPFTVVVSRPRRRRDQVEHRRFADFRRRKRGCLVGTRGESGKNARLQLLQLLQGYRVVSHFPPLSFCIPPLLLPGGTT